MFDTILTFFRSLFSSPQHEELLVRVRVEEKRDLLRRR